MRWRLFLVTVLCLLLIGLASGWAFWFPVREPSALASNSKPLGERAPTGGTAPPRQWGPPQGARAGAEMAMRGWSQAYWSRVVVESPKSKMLERGPTDVPLAKDSPMPPLEAPGWLNGVLQEQDLQGKVLVVDIWDGACPYCSMSAPALIKVYNKFRDQGVVFLGMTSADADDARRFVDALKLPWPNAYDAGETIDKLGANGPTVFVVGADGRVLWNDGKARYKHDLDQYGERLDRAIQQAVGLP